MLPKDREILPDEHAVWSNARRCSICLAWGYDRSCAVIEYLDALAHRNRAHLDLQTFKLTAS